MIRLEIDITLFLLTLFLLVEISVSKQVKKQVKNKSMVTKTRGCTTSKKSVSKNSVTIEREIERGD